MSSLKDRMNHYVCHVLLLLCLSGLLHGLELRANKQVLCKEGTVEAHPGDCASYVQCLNGQVLTRKCHNGTYFDAQNEVCVIDIEGVCASAHSSCGYLHCISQRFVAQQCPPGSYFNKNLGSCEIDTEGICARQCVDDELKQDLNNCAGYLECINGSLVPQSCPSGTFFDVSINTCEIDENGVCVGRCSEGEVKEDTTDCAGYLKCINGSLVELKCAENSFFNASLKICEIDENGICLRMCVEGEVVEDNDDCAGYLECINGSLVKVKCAEDTFFNATLSICEIDEKGVCMGRCVDGEIDVDYDDCAGYLKCINGSLVQRRCAENSFFNVTLKICEIDEDGNCIGRCAEGEIDENHDDCAGYLKCINGSLVEMKCAENSFFNGILNICEIDENGVCLGRCVEGEIDEDQDDCAGYLKCVNGSIVEKKCSGGSFFNASLQACQIDEKGVCIPLHEQCKEGEVGASPDNKCGYVQCRNGNLIDMSCAPGTYFNSTMRSCLVDLNSTCSTGRRPCVEGELLQDAENCGDYLECIKGAMVRRHCTFGSYFNNDQGNCVVDVDGVCTSLLDQCVEGDREIDPDDCAAYIECVDGDFISQRCAIGSYFDSSILACIIDESFVCLKQSKLAE